MVEDFVPSAFKPPGRQIWALDHTAEDPAHLLEFLDAELYLERVNAAHVVRRLQDGRIPAVAAVFVSSDNTVGRHADYACDRSYSHFLVDELLPYLFARNSRLRPDCVVLIGLSLSGLAAAYAAVTTGGFRSVVCQSPSFWWEHERFMSSLPKSGETAVAFWVSVGDLETQLGVSHPPSNMFQATSQRESCNRGCEALRAAGYEVLYRVFPGGHDPECWTDDLVLALPWATTA